MKIERGRKPRIFKVKWKQKPKTLRLRAAKGKWVSGPRKGADVTTVAKAADATTVFELVKNPKIVKAAPKRR